jgi:hypothetical protein
VLNGNFGLLGTGHAGEHEGHQRTPWCGVNALFVPALYAYFFAAPAMAYPLDST